MSNSLGLPTGIAPPEPGVYRDVPASIYHSWPLASNSNLGQLKRAPIYCHHQMHNPSASTPAKIKGEATHLMVLQPDEFKDRFAIAGQCEAMTQKGGRCSKGGSVFRSKQWFCGQHDPLGNNPEGGAPASSIITINQDVYDTCRRMRDAVMDHPEAREILAAATDIEISGIWHHSGTGVRCKMRDDIIVPAAKIIADVKTTRDASERAFEKSIYQYGYYRQGGMYQAGWKELGQEFESFVLIAVENHEPYGVAVYELQPEVLEAGRADMEELLKIYKKCQDAGVWPGYPQGIRKISLPAYAWKELERDSANELEGAAA